jgi:hypothetical protein
MSLDVTTSIDYDVTISVDSSDDTQVAANFSTEMIEIYRPAPPSRLAAIETADILSGHY